MKTTKITRDVSRSLKSVYLGESGDVELALSNLVQKSHPRQNGSFFASFVNFVVNPSFNVRRFTGNPQLRQIKKPRSAIADRGVHSGKSVEAANLFGDTDISAGVDSNFVHGANCLCLTNQVHGNESQYEKAIHDDPLT